MSGYTSDPRIRWTEWLPWIAALAFFFPLPEYLSLGARILIYILFALSLDLILGYAGIITLGHSAFFGLGAYTAGVLGAKYGVTDPFLQARRGRGAAALLGIATGAVILRTQRADAPDADAGDHLDPARDRQQGDRADRRRRRPLGRDRWRRSSACSGSTCSAGPPSSTAWWRCSSAGWSCGGMIYSPFGAMLTGIRENTRAHARGRRAGVLAPGAGLHDLGDDGRHRRRAAYAGEPVRRPRTCSASTLGRPAGHADPRRRRPPLRRLRRPGRLPHRAGLRSPSSIPSTGTSASARCSSSWCFSPAAASSACIGQMAAAFLRPELCKSFGALTVAENIDFRLEPGARHALIGPNGAGKTTFVNMLTGALAPSSGRILLGGEDITRPASRRASAPASAAPSRSPRCSATCRCSTTSRSASPSARRREAHVGARLLPGNHRESEPARGARHRRRRRHARGRPALRQAAPGRDRDRARPQAKVLLLDEPAAGVPVARIRQHPRRPGEAAGRNRHPDHRARHGPGVPLRAAASRCWCRARCWCEGTPRGDRAPTSACARCISGSGRMLSLAFAACARATARP